jgi:hypothetical protein
MTTHVPLQLPRFACPSADNGSIDLVSHGVSFVRTIWWIRSPPRTHLPIYQARRASLFGMGNHRGEPGRQGKENQT